MGMKILIEMFFSLKKDRTKGHEVKLVKDQSRLDIIIITALLERHGSR